MCVCGEEGGGGGDGGWGYCTSPHLMRDTRRSEEQRQMFPGARRENAMDERGNRRDQ